MKFKLQFRPNKRRGLSSVVGSLIFVVLMVNTFTVLGETFDAQSNLSVVAKQIADTGLKKQQEEFNIIISTDESQVLDVTVINSGQNSIEILNMIITNSSDAAAGYPTTVYNIPSDASFVGVGKDSNILSTMPITMELNNTYEIKVISSLGTIKKGDLVCVETHCGLSGLTGLVAEMFLTPPIGIPTKNVTAIMSVTNTGNFELTNVQPVFANPVIELPPTSSMIGPTLDSTFPVSLGPNQSVFFKWDLTVDGFPGDVWNFTNAATGLDSTLSPITSQNSTDKLILINPNGCGGCEEIEDGQKLIALEDVLIRPSIFMTIPSPFGEFGEKALWGINIANPTNSTITVNRVVVTAIAPGSSDQDIFFPDLGNCDPVSVGSANYAAVSDSWHCDQENAMYWQNYTSPVILDPYSAQSFLVKMAPGQSGASSGVSTSQLISAMVFSSAGSFAKDDYQTVMIGGATNTPGNMVNLYMSPEINGHADDKIETMRLDITSGSTETFKIVLADFDEDDNVAIDIGTKVIINIPRNWTFDGFNSFAGFENPPTYKVHADGSTQIIGTTIELIGNINGAVDARTISFDAIAPDVTTDSMYAMYVLATGETVPFDAPIGPVSEIILHVKP